MEIARGLTGELWRPFGTGVSRPGGTGERARSRGEAVSRVMETCRSDTGCRVNWRRRIKGVLPLDGGLRVLSK
jgi:hypothetical protein